MSHFVRHDNYHKIKHFHQISPTLEISRAPGKFRAPGNLMQGIDYQQPVMSSEARHLEDGK